MVPAAAPRPARVDTYDAADPLEDVEDERLLGDAMGDGRARDFASLDGKKFAPIPADAKGLPSVPELPVLSTEDEDKLFAKISWRILPVHFTLAMCCFIDRTNLSYGALQLNEDLGFGPEVYGLGAGIFFISYTAFQIPSDMVIGRVGAPLWLALILFVWGGLAACMAGIRSQSGFFVLRLFLGAAEAGTFPGIWHHLAMFYSPRTVGEAYTRVATVTAFSSVVGGPLAALLMQLDGAWGLRGWQWLFMLEGSLTALASLVVLFGLPKSPDDTPWLTVDEKRHIAGVAAASKGTHRGPSCADLATAVKSPAPWHLGAIWGLSECSMYGCTFWIPLIVRGILGIGKHASGRSQAHDIIAVSLVSAVPFTTATVAMLYVAHLSAVRDERKWHMIVSLMAGALFLGVLTPLLGKLSSVAGIASLSVATGSVWAIHGPIMSLPAILLPSSARAAGVALMNSLGATGGFVGPYLIGVLADDGRGYGLAMFVLGVLLVASAALTWLVKEDGGAAGDGGGYASVATAEGASFESHGRTRRDSELANRASPSGGSSPLAANWSSGIERHLLRSYSGTRGVRGGRAAGGEGALEGGSGDGVETWGTTWGGDDGGGGDGGNEGRWGRKVRLNELWRKDRRGGDPGGESGHS